MHMEHLILQKYQNLTVTSAKPPYDEEEQQRSLEWLKHRHSVNDMKAFESVIDSLLLYYQLRETNP